MSRLPVSAFTAFLDIPEEDQVTEVEEYLKGKGFDIIVDEDDAEVIDRLHRICKICCDLYRNPESTQQELEGLVYSIASLFHIIDYDEAIDVLKEMCVMITSGVTKDNVQHKMRMLWLLFSQFDSWEPIAGIVMRQLVAIAASTGEGPLLNIDLEQLKKWMNLWKFSQEEKLAVLRNLWEAYKSSDNTSIMVDILTELLDHYYSSIPSSSTLASDEAAALARKLLILLLANPDRYNFDSAMSLEPVKLLKGEKIYKLYQIFVSGKLSEFSEFCEPDRSFFDSLELDYKLCWRKMQILTLVSLTAESQEVTFPVLCTELRLETDELEQVILDAIRLKLLTARIDHVNKKLLVRSCIQRTFGIEQWKQVHAHLSSWKQSIHTIRDNLDSLSLQIKQSLPQQ